MSKLIKEILDALNAVNQNKTQPYDRQGEVKRIEGKTAWVKLEGSDRETPIQMTIACDVGDTVQARIGGGSAWLTGNLTAPPTDDKKANEAISMVTTVVQEVQEQVEEALEEATDVEDVTMQYCLSDSSSTFVQYGDWSDTPPEYVSGKYYWVRSVLVDDEGNETYGEPRYSQDTQLSVETDVAFKSNNNHFWHDSSGAYVTTADKSYANGSAVRITASGILQQVNGSTVSSWTNSGISFLQGGSTVASFGSGGAYFYNSSGDSLSLSSSGIVYKITPTGQSERTVFKIYDDGSGSHVSGRSGYYLTIDTGVYTNAIIAPTSVSSNTFYSQSSGKKLLTIDWWNATSITVAAGSTASGNIDVSKKDYTPIGVVGWNIDGSGMSFITFAELYVSGSNVHYYCRNHGSSSYDIDINVYVLYVASSQGV